MFEFIEVESENSKHFQQETFSAKFFYNQFGWSKFLSSIGYEVESFFILLNGEIIGNFFIEYHRRRFARYGYIPSGVNLNSSITKSNETEFFIAFSEFLKKKCRDMRVNSIRFDYFGHLDLDNLGYDISLSAGIPKYMWEIDLTNELEEIKKAMSDSTRHNVNKGERSSIKFIKGETSKEVLDFFSLMSETTNRKGFMNFNSEYFKSQFDLLKGGLCDLFLCYIDDIPISAAWINYGTDTVFYTHGASTSNREFSKLRSPYLLQWSIIKEMKTKGFKKYNMWGVLPDHMKNSGHSLLGVSDFKKSFGGEYLNSRGLFEVYSGKIQRLFVRAYDWWVYRDDRF